MKESTIEFLESNVKLSEYCLKRIVIEIGVEITSYKNDIEGIKDKIEEVFENRKWNW